jgi:tetratricopeptide (TPR) repeat protein
VELLSIGREFSEKLGQHWWKPGSNHFLGEVYFETGQYQKAKDHYYKAASLFDHYGNWPSTTIVSKIGLVRAQILNSEKDFNIETLYRYVSAAKTKVYKGWIRRYMGEILLNIDDQHIFEAEEWIKKAIEADIRNDMRWSLGRDYALYAKLFKRKSDLSKAKEKLGKAIEIMKECSADGWVEKYEKELAALS